MKTFLRNIAQRSWSGYNSGMAVAKKYLYPILVALVILTGVFVRFYQLGTIPPGVHYDEAYNGMDALWANETGDYKVFYPDNTGREGFHINVIAFFLKIFGNSNWGLRFANAMWGSLTLIGFFFLLRELKFSRWSVILGTFLLATSFWHLVFSRTAYRAIMVPFVLVWSFYFFWKGMANLKKDDKKSKRLAFIFLAASGLFFGLGFHTYIAFRAAPLVFALVGLSFIFSQKDFLKINWKSVMVFSLAVILISLPMIWYFWGNFNELVYRSDSVSVFNAKGMNFCQAFWKSLSAHLGAFFNFGDHNPRHNFNDQPLLPHAWAVLFVIGFLISAWEIFLTFKKKVSKWFHVSVLAQSMFWVMLLPGVMSIEGIPHSLRIIGTIPAVFLMMTLAVEYFSDLKKESVQAGRNFPKKINLIIFGGLILVVFGGFSQIQLYFTKWASDTRTEGAYERKLFDFGHLIGNLPLKNDNYIITAFNTTIYPGNHQSSLKTAEFVGFPNSQRYLFMRPMDNIQNISCDDPQIVFLESDQWLRDQYRSRCPDLKSRRFGYDNSKYSFWVMSYDIDKF